MKTKSMTNPKFRLFLWYAATAVAIALDQLTKWLAVRFLKGEESIAIVPDALHLTYVTNRGAAFSMLADQRWIFLVLSSVTVVLLIVLLYRWRKLHGLFCLSLAMILGGGIGNMIDRIALGYVVDFIDFRLINFAVFNVADSFVCIGCALLFIYMIFLDKKQQTPLMGDKQTTPGNEAAQNAAAQAESGSEDTNSSGGESKQSR